MKNIVLLLGVILSAAGAFEVNKSETFSKELEPTKMSSTIFATMESLDKSEIQKLFNEAIEGVKSTGICKNGSYRISPMYRYDRGNKRTFRGYQGDVNFKCEFNDVEKFDIAISAIDEVGDNKEKLRLTINPIAWIVEKAVINKSNQELELESLKYAESYKNFLSSVYKSTCKIKEVSLDSVSQPDYPRPIHGIMMRESMSKTTEPIKSSYTLKYRSSYKFECD